MVRKKNNKTKTNRDVHAEHLSNEDDEFHPKLYHRAQENAEWHSIRNKRRKKSIKMKIEKHFTKCRGGWCWCCCCMPYRFSCLPFHICFACIAPCVCVTMNMMSFHCTIGYVLRHDEYLYHAHTFCTLILRMHKKELICVVCVYVFTCRFLTW